MTTGWPEGDRALWVAVGLLIMTLDALVLWVHWHSRRWFYVAWLSLALSVVVFIGAHQGWWAR